MTEPKRRPLIERLGANAEEVEALLVQAYRQGRIHEFFLNREAGHATDTTYFDKWLDENFGGKE